jgi:hypothetical protein
MIHVYQVSIHMYHFVTCVYRENCLQSQEKSLSAGREKRGTRVRLRGWPARHLLRFTPEKEPASRHNTLNLPRHDQNPTREDGHVHNWNSARRRHTFSIQTQFVIS